MPGSPSVHGMSPATGRDDTEVFVAVRRDIGDVADEQVVDAEWWWARHLGGLGGTVRQVRVYCAAAGTPVVVVGKYLVKIVLALKGCE